MRRHHLKMNPAKCAFGVSAGNFLGFLVHHRGIEVDENKARAILNAPPPTTKKQLQSLLGQINFLRRFIANSAGKMKAFSTLLKLKDSDKFEWREEHQAAFTQIKVSLTKPPVLVPLGAINPSNFTYPQPRNPSAVSSLKTMTQVVSRPYSTSAAGSTRQKSITPSSRSCVWLYSSPHQSSGTTCYRQSLMSSFKQMSSDTCSLGQ